MEPDHVLRRCLLEDKVFDVLQPNGGHFAAKSKTLKVFMLGTIG